MTGGDRGDRDMYKGWREMTGGDSGCTGGDRERLGRTGDMYRGWLGQTSGIEDTYRGWLIGIDGRYKDWQGWIGDFQWDSRFWNQYYCLTMHITENFILVCMSVFSLPFCLSINLLFSYRSMLIYFLLILLTFLMDTGLYKLFSILLFCLSNKTFSLLCLALAIIVFLKCL